MTSVTEAVSKSGSPARVSSAARLSAIKVEPLTCTIGAEILNVSIGDAARDADIVSEIRSLLLKHKVLFFRDQDISRADHVAFARHFGELEDHPVAGSDPDHPGLVRIYKSPELAERPLRELLAQRRHLARQAALRLRAALRRVSRGRRRHDVGQHGRRLRAAAGADQVADRGPPRAPQHRGFLRGGDADREAPRSQGAVPRRRAPGGAHPSRDRGEGAVRQRLHHPLHQLPHRRRTCASARTTRPAPASC